MERLPYIAVLGLWSLLTLSHWLPGVMPAWIDKHSRTLGWTAVVLHIVALAAAAGFSSFPVGFPEAISAMALGTGIAYAYVADGKTRTLGLLLAPATIVLLGVAQVVPHRTVAALDDTGFSPWLPIHLGLIFSGLGGFALASAVGAMYLWVRGRLKAKRFAGLARLPSLEVLDRIQFRAMLFGFIFLTLGIGAGGAWAAASLQETWTIDPKVVWTVLIWAWYGAALQVRLVLGRRGRWTAIFSIVGFAGLLFSMMGVSFVMSGFHSYGS